VRETHSSEGLDLFSGLSLLFCQLIIFPWLESENSISCCCVSHGKAPTTSHRWLDAESFTAEILMSTPITRSVHLHLQNRLVLHPQRLFNALQRD
jgi:hypothetical protein